MNDKKQINYFRQSDLPRLLGAALWAIGLMLLFCSGFLDVGAILVVFAWIAFPIGLVMFIVAASIRTDEEEMDKHITRQTEGVAIHAAEEDKYRKRLAVHIKPKTVEGYEYREGLLYFKDKVGTVRSSAYTKTVFYMLRDGIFAVSRTVSLVSEEMTEERVEILFSDIERIEIHDEKKAVSCGKRSFMAKDTRFEIIYGDGKCLSVPAHRDVDIEHYVEKLCEWIEESQGT